ncbi:MAG TPA: NAD(P)/FAD-dependent oxidoreductase [Thermodesulfovibrionales bacterium]|nr:NAD(P)/FAD-dependent oxidoreductase [Thermodesulfovibrionales bacterium]
MVKKDVTIIGAGAAGLMCAIAAGRRGRSVVVLDHGERIGNKIRVSGGGRCNFTNANISHENYLSCNPHFCKSALSRFTPHDIIEMLRRHNFGYHEREKGRLFCKGSSLGVVTMLRRECIEAGGEIRLKCRILNIEKKGLFAVATSLGCFQSESLVIATGGLSYAGLGATDFGYRTAEEFGIAVTELQPALVPFTFNAGDLNLFRELSGIPIDAAVSCGDKRFRENILFTHRGMSGPAILQISLYWERGDSILIDLLPERDANELFTARRKSRTEMRNLLAGFLPKRFVERWLDFSTIRSKPICQYAEKELRSIAHQLHNWEVRPAGTEGYEKAEVTSGGVSTDELSSKTMEARKVHGLFFIGEVVDVTGQLGGYNLHWAWASGYAAGQYA